MHGCCCAWFGFTCCRLGYSIRSARWSKGSSSFFSTYVFLKNQISLSYLNLFKDEYEQWQFHLAICSYLDSERFYTNCVHSYRVGIYPQSGPYSPCRRKRQRTSFPPPIGTRLPAVLETSQSPFERIQLPLLQTRQHSNANGEINWEKLLFEPICSGRLSKLFAIVRESCA